MNQSQKIHFFQTFLRNIKNVKKFEKEIYSPYPKVPGSGSVKNYAIMVLAFVDLYFTPHLVC